MLTAADIEALIVTLKLAATTTAILLVLAVPLSLWLVRKDRHAHALIESIIALPLVLPPTVLGFYLLILLGAEGPVGRLATALGIGPLAFTFSGLVIGSCIYSLPFAVQPLRDSLAAIPRRQWEAAATLGASPLATLFRIILPQARNGLLTAAVLTFAHTIGEFGVVLMIGGNIPGRTQVLSIAIYDHVEALDYAHAHVLSAGLLIAAFVMLALLYRFNRNHGVLPR